MSTRASCDDQFLDWLHHHPDATRRRCFEAGAQAAVEVLERHYEKLETAMGEAWKKLQAELEELT